MALELVVYGAPTCEDTALVRSRLAALEIAYRYVDVSADSLAAAYVERLNKGLRITPTLVLGAGQKVLAEPALAELDRVLQEAGHRVAAPLMIRYEATPFGAPLPDFALPSAAGDFHLSALRGQTKSVLFFAHGADCLACLGYARQLAGQRTRLAEAEARAVFIVQGMVAPLWREEITGGYPLLFDSDSAVKRRIAETVEAKPEHTLLLIIDAYTTPRFGATAVEAGGLIAPHEAASLLSFLDRERPE